MSKQMLVFVGLLLLAFASGIGIGLFVGNSSPASSVAEKSNASSAFSINTSETATTPNKPDSLLGARVRELEKELEDQKKERTSIMADRIAFFKKYHASISVQPYSFTEPVKVSAEMAELLGFTKGEEQAINQHLSEAADAMKQLEETNIHLIKQSANGITVETPSNPDGKAIEAKLNDQIVSDIGQERADFFLGATQHFYNDPFGGFAEQRVEMEITWAQQNGVTQYTWKQTGYNPDGRSTGWSSSTGTSLPTRYENFLKPASAQ